MEAIDLEVKMLCELSNAQLKSLLRKYGIKLEKQQLTKKKAKRILETQKVALEKLEKFGIHMKPSVPKQTSQESEWRIDAVHALLEKVSKDDLISELKEF